MTTDLVANTLVPHTAFDNAIQRVTQCIEHTSRTGEGACIAVVGESRTGKSRVQKHIASKYPQRRTPGGLHTPVLRITTPARPSVKALAAAIIENLGDPVPGNATEEALTRRATVLVENTRTDAVFIDEFQQFFDQGSNRVCYHATDWLKTFVDRSGLTLVVAGLPTCLSIIEQNQQLAGRFLAPVRMPRFNWEDDGDVGVFKGILQAFEESLRSVYDCPDLASDEMAFRFYCASGGLIGYVTKLLRQAEWNAADAKSKKITLACLERAHAEAISTHDAAANAIAPFAPAFAGLATPDLLSLARVIGTADLRPIVARPRRSRSKARQETEASSQPELV